MNLAIDIGNTRIKAGVFEGEVLVECMVVDMSGDDLIATFSRMKDVQNVIICSVNDAKVDIEELLPEVSGVVINLTDKTRIPIVNSYETPATLGKDRLAAAVGGYHLFKGSNVLVVDAGTCITYDLITAEGEFIGGNIAPGLDMRLQAMHDYTARLPLVGREVGRGLMGRTTEEAISNGAVNGILHEIEGYVRHLISEYENIETILTGGDGRFFGDLMKTKIFVRSNLVLIGLNEILKVNVEEYN